MSYNITAWKTKRIDGLLIPLEAITRYKTEMHRRGWPNPTIQANVGKDSLELKIEPVESSTIKGYYLFANNMRQLEITILFLKGEASGTYYHEILLPALKESIGILDAVLVWEGGDSISRLRVDDGNVKEENVIL